MTVAERKKQGQRDCDRSTEMETGTGTIRYWDIQMKRKKDRNRGTMTE